MSAARPPEEMVARQPDGSRIGHLKLHALRARLSARRRAATAKASVAWQGLAERERRLLTVCAMVVAGALCWLVAIEPALKAIEHWQQELPKLRSQAAAVESVLAEVPNAPSAHSSATYIEETLIAQLDATPMAGRYRLERIRQDAAWLLTVTSVAAQDLVPWLLRQPQRLGLSPAEITLAQTAPPGGAPEKGALSGTVRLAPAVAAKEER